MEEDWITLWDKAKAIEKRLPELRNIHITALRQKFPEVKEKQLHTLHNACKKGKYSKDIIDETSKKVQEVESLKIEAGLARTESDRILELKIKNDTRRILDPIIDTIPAGKYSKLRNCNRYPNRKSCNYGENEEFKWERCEFMKYDQKQSDWVCNVPG